MQVNFFKSIFVIVFKYVYFRTYIFCNRLRIFKKFEKKLAELSGIPANYYKIKRARIVAEVNKT